ncbi:WxL protein peptidoglycan domain-containing protein [Lacticaseibacillus absianus]|uniref:WxL protein peptidoglycan domain-containing protein n=1 Tax=Lacticaseibacillus absianus TaxID=2729623 RepID=UPI0015C88DED
MRRHRVGWLLALLLLLAPLSDQGRTAHADGTKGVQSVPLSVIPVTNTYQIGRNKGYFDLKMAPGQSTELQVKLANSGRDPLVVRVDATAASTNDSAQVDYTNTKTTYDATMKYPLPTLIKIPKSYQRLTIPARTTATYHLPLTMPSKAFDGVILGGLRVRPVTATTKQSGISNQYAYVMAVQLSNGTAARPDLTLKSVEVARVANQTTVNATLQNPEAALLLKGKIEARVTKQGQNRTLKSLVMNEASTAPNSRFTVKVPWGGAIAPGAYTLHLTYRSTDKQFFSPRTWTFTKNFQVTTLQAMQYTLAELHIPWWAYALLVLILLLLVIVIILLLKRRKGGKQRDKDSLDESHFDRADPGLGHAAGERGPRRIDG